MDVGVHGCGWGKVGVCISKSHCGLTIGLSNSQLYRMHYAGLSANNVHTIMLVHMHTRTHTHTQTHTHTHTHARTQSGRIENKQLSCGKIKIGGFAHTCNCAFSQAVYSIQCVWMFMELFSLCSERKININTCVRNKEMDSHSTFNPVTVKAERLILYTWVH